MQVVNNFNCRGFGPLLEDKLCLIFKLAPSVCRMTFPILASLLVRLVVLLPFQLLRLSLATPSRWTRSEERFSRNAETDLVCRLLLEKKNSECRQCSRDSRRHPAPCCQRAAPRRRIRPVAGPSPSFFFNDPPTT